MPGLLRRPLSKPALQRHAHAPRTVFRHGLEITGRNEENAVPTQWHDLSSVGYGNIQASDAARQRKDCRGRFATVSDTQRVGHVQRLQRMRPSVYRPKLAQSPEVGPQRQGESKVGQEEDAGERIALQSNWERSCTARVREKSDEGSA